MLEVAGLFIIIVAFVWKQGLFNAIVERDSDEAITVTYTQADINAVRRQAYADGAEDILNALGKDYERLGDAIVRIYSGRYVAAEVRNARLIDKTRKTARRTVRQESDPLEVANAQAQVNVYEDTYHGG